MHIWKSKPGPETESVHTFSGLSPPVCLLSGSNKLHYIQYTRSVWGTVSKRVQSERELFRDSLILGTSMGRVPRGMHFTHNSTLSSFTFFNSIVVSWRQLYNSQVQTGHTWKSVQLGWILDLKSNTQGSHFGVVFFWGGCQKACSLICFLPFYFDTFYRNKCFDIL